MANTTGIATLSRGARLVALSGMRLYGVVLALLLSSAAAWAGVVCPPGCRDAETSSELEPTLRLELFASDVQPVTVAGGVELGRFHATLVLGAGRGSQYAGGLAVGVTLGGSRAVELDGAVLLVQALTAQASGLGPVSLLDYETDLLSQLRLTYRWTLAERLALFAGVTANYEVSFGPNVVLRGSYVPPLVRLAPPTGGGGHQLWPGALAGLRW